MKKREKRLYLLLIPSISLLVLFVFVPLVKGIVFSFTDWNGFSQTYNYIGFDNYQKLFTDRMIIRAFRNTIYVGFGDTLIQNLLGLSYALLLNKYFRTRNIVRLIIYLPVIVSGLIMGYVWYFIVEYDNGALNDLVSLFGVGQTDWLGDGDRAVNFIMVITSLQFVGQAMIIYLAGLQLIPKTLYEASSIDGASKIQQFFRITLPMLKPAIITTVTLKLIGGLQLYDLVVALTNGGPGFSSHTISTMISFQYFEMHNAGYSAALGITLFAIIMSATLTVNKFINRRSTL